MVAKARALVVVNLSSRNLRSGAADHARSQLEVHYGSIVDRFSDAPRSISVGGGRNRRIDAGQCDADPVCVLLGRERASRVSAALARDWARGLRLGDEGAGERTVVQPPHPRRTTGWTRVAAKGLCMSATGLEVFDKTVQTTNAW